MKWVTWYNLQGQRTKRAHVASTYLVNRTVCGFRITTLIAPVPRGTPRCHSCKTAIAKGEK
jgi:hypothetical protein